MPLIYIFYGCMSVCQFFQMYVCVSVSVCVSLWPTDINFIKKQSPHYAGWPKICNLSSLGDEEVEETIDSNECIGLK